MFFLEQAVLSELTGVTVVHLHTSSCFIEIRADLDSAVCILVSFNFLKALRSDSWSKPGFLLWALML